MTGDWEALGRAVYRARSAAGLIDTKAWAARIGRSTRVLLGLERGEPTGTRTLLLIEEELDWPAGWCHRILSGEVDGAPTGGIRGSLTLSGQGRVQQPTIHVGPTDENPVLDAIAADPHLLPDTRDHLMNQYRILRRVDIAAAPKAEDREEESYPRAARRGKPKKALEQDEQGL